MLTALALRHWGSRSRICGEQWLYDHQKSDKGCKFPIHNSQTPIVVTEVSVPSESGGHHSLKDGGLGVLKKSSHGALRWWEARALEEQRPPLTRPLALVLDCTLKEKTPFLILVKVSWVWATVLATLPKRATWKLPLKFCLCPSCMWYKALLLGVPEDACFHPSPVSRQFTFLQKHP